MSHYSWSKRYQIPNVCFKTEKSSYQSKGFNNRLRQTIDIGSVRNEDHIISKQKIKTGFTDSLRHTTSHSTTLSDLLGKSYKYFEPRPAKQKKTQPKNTSYDDYNNEIAKRLKISESPSDTSWCQPKFKSLKDIKEIENQINSEKYDQSLKLWKSSNFLPNYFSNQKVKTPQKVSFPQKAQSPYTFIKKNKLLYNTPHSIKQQSTDQSSTKFSSPTSSSQSSIKFLALRQIKKDVKKPLTLADFVIIKHLGEGRFGAVSMAFHKQSGFLVALKRVKKQIIKSQKLQNQFMMEIKMQLFLKHPNILKLYGYFDDLQNIYLILEFMEQGTLFNKLKKEKQKHFDEKVASQKLDDILHAIKYMHELEIAHRDIKPQNIVLSHGVCKVCDFGWAAICEDRRTTLCGTIDYAPPEVLEGKEYGITMDLWCLGVLCYELLVGKAPFYHVSRKQTMQKIIKADTSDLKIPEHLSEQALDFISKMLVKDPDQRMFTQEAMKHEFIVKNLQKDNQKLRAQKRL